MNFNPALPDLMEDERLDQINEGLRLIQKKQGLTFGTDAFLLAAFTRGGSQARAVDLGSGTGIIPLLLCAANKLKSVTAVEIQSEFAELISRNARLNGLSDRISVLCRDVRLLTAADVGGEVDVVCSNPPYLKSNAGKSNRAEEKEIARHEVYGDIHAFCAAASRLLKTKGKFFCVYRSERLVDLLDAMRCNRLEPKRMIMVHADHASPPCMVLVEAMKDAAPSLNVLPPLFLYTEQQTAGGTRMRTAEAAHIYNTCSFPTRERKIPTKAIKKEIKETSNEII